MIRPFLIAVALVAIALTNVCNCHAQSADHVLTLRQYAEAGGLNDAPDGPIHKLKGNAAFSLTFPRFDVYSPAGDLIYHTTDLNEIRHFLDRFPRSARNLHTISGTESWSSIASKYHLDNPSTPASSVRGRYTFLSLITEECNACSMERGVLDEMTSRLASQGVHQEVLVLSP
jgi:hypothetical protein